MSWSFNIIVFILGLVFGSFLNVVILRVPEKKSIVWPGSHCPVCGNELKWWMNIPLVSFLFLRGKCAWCGTRISLQYPVVEFMSGMIFLLMFLRFGGSAQFVFFAVHGLILLAIFVIDVNTQLILNKVLFMWLLWSVIHLFTAGQIIYWNWILGVTGAIVGGFFLWFVAWLGNRLFGKESLGMGDVKFGMVAGFLLGVDLIIPMILFGSLLAMLVMLPFYFRRLGKKQVYFPFGPFLTVSTYAFMFWGDLYRTYSLNILENMFK